jgi:hypothetical protein
MPRPGPSFTQRPWPLWVPAQRRSLKNAAPRPGHECGSQAAGTGNAVTDLIFSIAKREVTFFSGTVPISFL